MKYTEWQAEYARISADIAKIQPECKALQDKGDWMNVSVLQAQYYALLQAQADLKAREPDKTGPQASDIEPTFEEWLSESDWISHDLDAIKMEWDVFRKAGDWAGAQIPQQKYHLLRARQAAHNKRRPKQEKKD